jgi:hypothetical protein
MILPPPPAFCRSRMNSRQQKKRAVEVCLQDAVELLGPHVEDRCTATPDAGVVDQDIWRAKGPRDDIEQGEDAPLISDIDLQGHRLPPHRLDTAAAFLGALLVSVKRDSDISPGAGELLGHGLESEPVMRAILSASLGISRISKRVGRHGPRQLDGHARGYQSGRRAPQPVPRQPRRLLNRGHGMQDSWLVLVPTPAATGG